MLTNSLGTELTKACAYIRILGITYETHWKADLNLRKSLCSDVNYAIYLAANSRYTDMRCAAMQAIATGPTKSGASITAFLPSIFNGLDDYSLDDLQRDIGADVRLAAIETAALVLRQNLVTSVKERQPMILWLCALATDSSDAVRYAAAVRLQQDWLTLGLPPDVKLP